MEKKYYVYSHINPINDEIFYIGKGCDKRAWSKSGRNKFWNNIVNQYGFEVKIIEQGLTSEESNQIEIFFIKKIGRKDLGLGPLVNMTDGGYSAIDYRSIHRKSKKAINFRNNLN